MADSTTAASTDWSQPSGMQAGGGMFGATVQPMSYGGWGGGYGYPQMGGYGYPQQMSYGGYPEMGGYGYPQQSYGGGYSSGYGGWDQNQMMMASGMQMPQQYSTQQAQTTATAPPPASGSESGAPAPAPALTAAAPAGGAQAPALSLDDIWKILTGGKSGSGGLFGSQNITQTINPWAPQGKQLEGLYKDAALEYDRQRQAGIPTFSQQSRDALAAMQQMAGRPNPLYTNAANATNDIASGGQAIGSGPYSDLYQNPGLTDLGRYREMATTDAQTGLQRYNQMYSDPGFTGQNQYQNLAGQGPISDLGRYREFAGQGPISGIGQYNELAQGGGITGLGQYGEMSQEDAIRNAADYRRGAEEIGSGRFREMYAGTQDPGILSGGMFGQVAKGQLVGGNPYREKALQQSMADVGNQVKATMSKAGRYGSDAYGEEMGRALGQVAMNARMQGYDTDTANMMAAAQARSGEGLARQGIGMQAAQGVLSTEQQNRANQLAAAQGISSMQGQNAQQRLQALQGMTGAQGQAAQNMLAAMQGRGGAQLQNQQAQLAALQGLSGSQLQNQQAQLAALQGMTNMQGMTAQQRMAALQGLGGAQSQNAQQQLAALQGLTGAQGQGWQQQLAAAQGLTGVQGQNIANRLAAAGMAPQMQQLRYDDMQRLLGVGATREAMTQQQRNFGWQQLQNAQGIYGNLPGTAGQTMEPGKPWWQQALGAGMALGGMFSGMGGQ